MFRKRSYICVFLQFGNTQRFEIWALNSTKMRLAAGLHPDLLGELYSYLPCNRHPVRPGGPRRHVAIRFGMEKPEWWFVSTQYERDKQIYRQMDAARRNSPRLHSITRQCSYKNVYKTQNAFTHIFNVQHVDNLFRNIQLTVQRQTFLIF